MDENPEVYNIPTNYKTAGKWRSISIPNLCEGVAVAVIVNFFLLKIPFTFQFKMVVTIVSFALIVVIFVRGINGERVSIFLLSFIKYLLVLLRRKTKYHMRKVEIKDVEIHENRNSGLRTPKNLNKFLASFKERGEDKDE